MYHTEVKRITCPYCGENIDIIIDTSLEQQQYIEDCQICCRPINLNVSIYPGDHVSHIIDIQALSEND